VLAVEARRAIREARTGGCCPHYEPDGTFRSAEGVLLLRPPRSVGRVVRNMDYLLHTLAYASWVPDGR
jgi:hypothetical protein